MTQTEEKTKFSKEPTITALLISASYIAALAFASPPTKPIACLNPAMGVSVPLIWLFDGNSSGIKWIWVYAVFPFVGGFLSVLFHEFVYKKVVDTIEESEGDDGILDK